jgi:hypothetical protein
MTITNRLQRIIIATALLLSPLMIFTPSVSAADYSCEQSGLSFPTCKEVNKLPPLGKNPIIAWINFFINFMSSIIIVGATIMIAVAGLQYLSSRDNAQSVQTAKQKILTITGALLFYFFLYAFVQWLVPGGVF